MERQRQTRGYRWIAAVFSIIIVLGFTGCGEQERLEVEYLSSIQEISLKIQVDTQELGEAFAAFDPASPETESQMLGILDTFSQTCQRQRDLQAPEGFADIQEAFVQAMDVWLEAAGQYREAVHLSSRDGGMSDEAYHMFLEADNQLQEGVELYNAALQQASEAQEHIQ